MARPLAAIVALACGLGLARVARADRPVEVGLQPHAALFRWGDDGEQADGRLGAAIGMDARWFVLPGFAVGVFGQRTFADGLAKSTTLGLAQIWFGHPGPLFRPSFGVGAGVIGSAVAMTPAMNIAFGIDWCVREYLRDDRSCGLAIGAPFFELTWSTSNAHLYVFSIGPRLAMRF